MTYESKIILLAGGCFIVALGWLVVLVVERDDSSRQKCEEIGGVHVKPYKSKSLCFNKEALKEVK